jgi:Protein of unknown function (DUF4239)
MKEPIAMSFEHSLVVHFHPWQLMLLCIIVPIVLSFSGLFIVRRFVPPESLRQYHDIAGPFLNTIGAIYGIFLALIVATTWQFYSTTGNNVVEEARCLQSLYLDAEAFPESFRDMARGLMRDYRDSLVTREWPSIQHGDADPETTELLHRIAGAYAHYKVKDHSEEAYFHESVKNINSLQSLRSSRIEDSGSGLIPFLWGVLFAGGGATVTFSFLFGAKNLHTHAIMTILLTGVIALALYTIVNLDFPFTGLVAIGPDAFSRLMLK